MVRAGWRLWYRAANARRRAGKTRPGFGRSVLVGGRRREARTVIGDDQSAVVARPCGIGEFEVHRVHVARLLRKDHVDLIRLESDLHVSVGVADARSREDSAESHAS